MKALSPVIILDTDIGYDPDDLFALLFLQKLAGDRVKLIITANETQEKRKRFLDQIISTIPDFNPKTAQGKDIGLQKFTVDGLLENNQEVPSSEDFIEEIKSIVDEFPKVTYIGIGGFSNLAGFIEKYPDDAKKMKIVAMGGAVNYERHTDWVEYNIKIDIPATRIVVESGCDVTYIMAQTTHNPIYEVKSDHSLIQKLATSNVPEYQLLYKHCQLWFEKRGHGTSMHDPLTVVTALGYEYATFAESKVVVTDQGKMVVTDQGFPIKYSLPTSQAADFMDFLDKTLFL
jgi:inosine-uridine nucleoside N-ribohydrolase